MRAPPDRNLATLRAAGSPLAMLSQWKTGRSVNAAGVAPSVS